MTEQSTERVSETTWGVWIPGIDQWMTDDDGKPYARTGRAEADSLVTKWQPEFTSKLEVRSMDSIRDAQVRAFCAMAIDGDDGGEYVPAGKIVVSGPRVTGDQQRAARYAVIGHAVFGEHAGDIPTDLLRVVAESHSAMLIVPFEAAVRICVSPHLAVALFVVDKKAEIDRVASDVSHVTRAAIARRMFAAMSEEARGDYVTRAKAIADAYVEQAE